MTILDVVTQTTDAIAIDDRYAAHNYSPLPVVAASAEGAWITDIDGRRYLDCLAAYSAVNFGHRNPEIIAAAHAQLDTVTLVSRAFHTDRLGPFCQSLAEFFAGANKSVIGSVQSLRAIDRENHAAEREPTAFDNAKGTDGHLAAATQVAQ